MVRPYYNRYSVLIRCNNCDYFWISDYIYFCPCCNSANLSILPINFNFTTYLRFGLELDIDIDRGNLAKIKKQILREGTKK